MPLISESGTVGSTWMSVMERASGDAELHAAPRAWRAPKAIRNARLGVIDVLA